MVVCVTDAGSMTALGSAGSAGPGFVLLEEPSKLVCLFVCLLVCLFACLLVKVQGLPYMGSCQDS